MDGFADIRFFGIGVNQVDDIGFGKDDALGIHGDFFFRLKTQWAHFINGYIKCPGHAFNKGTGAGRTFFINCKIHHIALLIDFSRLSLFSTNINSGSGTAKEKMSALGHGFNPTDRIVSDF